MDLYAYININKLSTVVEKNNINISRVRGYRLMKYEHEPIILNEKDIYLIQKDCIEELIFGIPKFAINYIAISYHPDKEKILSKYFDSNNKIKWNKIHGKFRRNLKYKLKQTLKNIKNNYNMFNKYIGRDDVLYIHAKLGSTNWSDKTHFYYKNEPWYLDSIDDGYDPVYCDIYAKINPDTIINIEKDTVFDNEKNRN